jgi:mono/diheme cytochrome c family protein
MLDRKMARRSIWLGVGGVTLYGLTALASTPATPAVAAAPSFTRVQAAFGQQVYAASCQGCHGANLQGVRGPALMGEAFLAKWADGKRPAQELHDYIAQKMPRNKPASLTPAQYRNVTAYVLSRNGYVAGTRSLSPTTLKAPLARPPAKAQ